MSIVLNDERQTQQEDILKNIPLGGRFIISLYVSRKNLYAIFSHTSRISHIESFTYRR